MLNYLCLADLVISSPELLSIEWLTVLFSFEINFKIIESYEFHSIQWNKWNDIIFHVHMPFTT